MGIVGVWVVLDKENIEEIKSNSPSRSLTSPVFWNGIIVQDSYNGSHVCACACA